MDYYKILGVDRNATQEEITRAFVRLRRKYANDEKMLIEITKAYEAIKIEEPQIKPEHESRKEEPDLEHAESKNYYEILGIARNATQEEITRAFVRLRRKYANDEKMKLLINEAEKVLGDAERRREYDEELRQQEEFQLHQDEIEAIQRQISNINEQIDQGIQLEQLTSEWFLSQLQKLKELYGRLIKIDPRTQMRIRYYIELADIEDLYPNYEQEIYFLKQAEALAKERTVEEEIPQLLIEIWKCMGQAYKASGRIDDAISCYKKIIEKDSSWSEVVTIIARLYYEEKGTLKTAIQFLNEYIENTDNTALKILYLCECLRGIKVSKKEGYQKLEEALYKKIQGFRTTDYDANLKNAAALMQAIAEFFDLKEYEVYHRLDDIIQKYEARHEQMDELLEAMRQFARLDEAKKIHKAVHLVQEDKRTEAEENELQRYVLLESVLIKESLDVLHREAPVFCKLASQRIEQLEQLVNQFYKLSKEYQSLLKERGISSYIKTILKYLILEGLNSMRFSREEVEEYRKAGEDFFTKEDRQRVEYTLRKLREVYPMCYEIYTSTFSNNQEVSNSGYNNVRHEMPVYDTSVAKDIVEQSVKKIPFKKYIWANVINFVVQTILHEEDIVSADFANDMILLGVIITILAVVAKLGKPPEEKKERKKLDRATAVKIGIICGLGTSLITLPFVWMEYKEKRELEETRQRLYSVETDHEYSDYYDSSYDESDYDSREVYNQQEAYNRQEDYYEEDYQKNNDYQEEDDGYSINQLETYDIEEQLTIPLKLSNGDSTRHYAVASVTIVVDNQHNDYNKYARLLTVKESLIKESVKQVIGGVTIEELSHNPEGVKEAVLDKLQNVFESDFIVDVAFRKLLFQ